MGFIELGNFRATFGRVVETLTSRYEHNAPLLLVKFISCWQSIVAV
jgi:hypothetical protein